MNPALTTILAIWGAALSTVVFLWDIRKWVRNNPRIAVKVEFHEAMTEDGEPWISYEIRNRGGRATTIEELMLVHYPHFPWGLIRYYPTVEYMHVSHKKTITLPVILQPNEVWKGHSTISREGRGLLEGNTEELFNQKKLHYKIRCAHTDRLVSGTVQPEDFHLRM